MGTSFICLSSKPENKYSYKYFYARNMVNIINYIFQNLKQLKNRNNKIYNYFYAHHKTKLYFKQHKYNKKTINDK